MKNSLIGGPIGHLVLVILGGVLLSGCFNVDTTYTLPSFDTNFNFPLPPGVPIVTTIPLPSVLLCQYISRDQIIEEIRKAPLGNLLVTLFERLVHIEEVSAVEATMVALTPENATFEGLTLLEFSVNGASALKATVANGIEGNTIHLTTAEPLNLVTLIDSCEESPAVVQVTAAGVIPSVPPTSWRNTISIHIRARIGLR